MATAVDQLLSRPCLRDFAQRCRRLATWERDPQVRILLLRRAAHYDRLAGPAEPGNDRS